MGIIGRIEFAKTANGNPAASVYIMTENRFYNSSKRAHDSETIWHKVICYKELANVVDNNATIGDVFFVEGSIMKKVFMKNSYEYVDTYIIGRQIRIIEPALNQKNKDIYNNFENFEDSDVWGCGL